MSSPQMNLRAMWPSTTGKKVKVNALKCEGCMYSRNLLGNSSPEPHSLEFPLAGAEPEQLTKEHLVVCNKGGLPVR